MQDDNTSPALGLRGKNIVNIVMKNICTYANVKKYQSINHYLHTFYHPMDELCATMWKKHSTYNLSDGSNSKHVKHLDVPHIHVGPNITMTHYAINQWINKLEPNGEISTGLVIKIYQYDFMVWEKINCDV